MEPFQKVKNWFLDSGLLIDNENDANFGGVHAFFDEKKNEFGFIYPEITGYAISTLRFLYDIEKNDHYLELAKQSSDWLISLYENHGGIIQRVDYEQNKTKLAYAFDTGICAKGLLDCYHMTEEKKYLYASQKLLDWLVDGALENDGTIKPFKNLSTNKFESSNKYWYTQKGCLHIKTAIPFFQLYEITKNDDLLKHAICISNAYEKFIQLDGSIKLHLQENIIHLHSLCYALEGLLHAYHITHDKKYLIKSKEALKWCNSKILSDGSIFLWYNSNYPQAKTSYHVAQLIRLMMLVDKVNDTMEWSESIDRLNYFLLSLQADSDDSRINGGFYEENYKSFLGWKKRKKVNSWGSMFALEALYWKDNYTNLSFESIIKFLF